MIACRSMKNDFPMAFLPLYRSLQVKHEEFQNFELISLAHRRRPNNSYELVCGENMQRNLASQHEFIKLLSEETVNASEMCFSFEDKSEKFE